MMKNESLNTKICAKQDARQLNCREQLLGEPSLFRIRAAAPLPLLDPATAAVAAPPSCLVGPVAAFNLTAPAAAVAAPHPHPLVLVDVAAAPSRWVDPVTAFGLTAPAAAAAAAAVAAPPPPHPLVLVDAAAAPSHWIDPVAAFRLTAPAAAAAPPPLSDPAAAVPPPLLGPAVGGVSPSPLPLLLTDGAPESSD